MVFGIWRTLPDGASMWATTGGGRLVVAETADELTHAFPGLGEPREIPNPIDVNVFVSSGYIDTRVEPDGQRLALSIVRTSGPESGSHTTGRHTRGSVAPD
jgi:hypothetical protein